MKPKKTFTKSRRSFIKKAIAVGGGLAITPQMSFGVPAYAPHLLKNRNTIEGVTIGLITYSFRALEDQTAEATLSYIKSCEVSAIEMMGGPAETFAGKPKMKMNRRAFYGLVRKEQNKTLTADETKELADYRAQFESYNKESEQWLKTVSLESFEKLGKMYADEGVSIYAYKPSLFSKRNSDDEIRFGMRAAKALGASHITLEHPSDDAHTLRLGTIAQQEKIYVAYHGHEQQTPTFWDLALQQSTYNAMNLDLGHYVAAGNLQPLQILKDKHMHIKSMHLKDRTTPNNGRKNLPWGTGETPIVEALQLMRDQQYHFPATVEYEYKTPEDSDVLTEVKRCITYCKTALSS